MRIYVVDKPLGVTSHDVVAKARKTLGTRRVGHGGTLDPLATGVLALLVDEATKLSPFLTDSGKHYLAWVSFGATTPTLDAEGPLVTEQGQTVDVNAQRIEAAFPKFLNLHRQVPPQYSAVKLAGMKGYEAARKGKEIDLPERAVGYHSIELLAFAGDRDSLPHRFAATGGRWLPSDSGREAPLPDPLATLPSALISLEVKAGTYVRSFARDLAAELGTVGFLSGLLRTAAGSLDLSQAVAPEELAHAPPLPPRDALGLPQIELDATQASRVRMGQRLSLPLDERTMLLDERGEIVAVAEQVEGRMKLLRVWS